MRLPPVEAPVAARAAATSQRHLLVDKHRLPCTVTATTAIATATHTATARPHTAAPLTIAAVTIAAATLTTYPHATTPRTCSTLSSPTTFATAVVASLPADAVHAMFTRLQLPSWRKGAHI